MLEGLLVGKEKSRFILIKDTAECPGRHLLLNWIKCLAERCEKVIAVCYERPTEFFKEWLPKEVLDRIVFLHGGGSEGGKDILFEDAIKAELTYPSVILFDSLTLPIIMKQVPQTCRALQRLITLDHVVQVLAVLHMDVHKPHICQQVGYFASSTVNLLSAGPGHNLCDVHHCSETEELFSAVEAITYDSNFKIAKVSPWKTPSGPMLTLVQASQTDQSTKHSISSTNSEKKVGGQSDPLSQLPFNLSLSDSEKEARSQVQLPYLKNKLSEKEEHSVSAKILYLPDELDDIDDEDPDDDLDI